MKKEKKEFLEKIVNDYKIVNSKIINSSFIKSKAYEFTLNNGLTLKREKIIKGGKDGSAVIIVPYIDNELLLVIEPRVFTKTGIGIGFPAGYIEENETPLEAALRELKEETGLKPKEIKEVDAFYQDEGCSSAYNHIFIAYDCKKMYDQNLDSDEYIEYMRFSEEEAFELEEKGYICGCNSKLVLQKLKRK